MSIFERVLGGNIFFDFWTQVQQYIFSEGRFIQLITLQPIEIYKTETELEIDTAKVKLFIKSNIENLMQRRIERTINILTLNLSKVTSTYDFDVVIKAQMDYEEVAKFFNHHFANQTYTIEEDKYYLFIEEFHCSNQGTKAVVGMTFSIESKRWFLKRKLAGKALFKGSINFHQPKYVVKTRNLNYTLETDSFILKILDNFYHNTLIVFLSDFLQYNFQQELLDAKIEAQNQINSFQSQTNWIKGNINELDLERVTIENEGVHAVFLAEGKLQLIR